MKPLHPLTVFDLRDLAGLRDELGPQAHLFEAGLQERWLEAERRYKEIENELHGVVERSRGELDATSGLVAETLRETYRELRQALQSR